jgi:hypothetical protein
MIDLPEAVFEALRSRAIQQDSSVEAVILQVIERAVTERRYSAEAERRVQLPLVPTKRPGTLRSLTGGEIDNLFG